MSQSTPTAVTKRKVMGRMDAGPSESPSNSLTPNARPRIVRAHHGYSSPSLSTPTANRPTPGTGRARVDMSSFASPSSVASSPAMSPSVSGRPVSSSSVASSTITARLSAPSPSVRSTPTFHGRSGSTVGSSVSSYKLAEARTEGPVDPNLASLRSPKIRGRNGSVDLSASPSIAPSSPRIPASSQLASSISLRSPIPRADQPQFQKPSTPSATIRPAPTVPARHLLSPQRSQETLERAVPIPKSRSPSPILTPAPLLSLASPASQQWSPSKQAPTDQRTEPVVPDRQASMSGPTPAPVAAGSLRASSGPGTYVDEHSIYSASPSDYRPIGNVGPSNSRLEPDSTMTAGRASLRPGPALQRSAMPPSFMDLAGVSIPVRPNAEQRNSFASSTFSAHSASQPLSPSSETPLSPSEAGEAEEARVHRKLLDLEITNKSLMAINSALEVTKLKQAKEIRELKRRLRDGRGLPVGAASRDSAGTAIFSDDEDLETDSDQDDDLLVQEDPELEAAHQRCKDLVDNMVEQARKAILAEYDEAENTGGKVLHPVEVEEMQRELEEGNDTEADTTVATDLLDTSITFDQSSGDTSKDELPSSSSLKFMDSKDEPSSSLQNEVNGIETSESTPSLQQSNSGLHPNSAYGRNLPPHGDVSID